MSVGLDPSMLSSQAQAGIDVQNKLRVDALTRTLNAGDTEEKKLREACRGFESAFLQKLMVQMRATVPKDGLLHGPYEDQYLSMFDQALADKLAESGGVGLADMMFSQLKDKIAGTKKSSSHPGHASQAGGGRGNGPDRTGRGRDVRGADRGSRRNDPAGHPAGPEKRPGTRSPAHEGRIARLGPAAHYPRRVPFRSHPGPVPLLRGRGGPDRRKNRPGTGRARTHGPGDRDHHLLLRLAQ